jgi:hypothetical protein
MALAGAVVIIFGMAFVESILDGAMGVAGAVIGAAGEDGVEGAVCAKAEVAAQSAPIETSAAIFMVDSLHSKQLPVRLL